MTDQLPIRVEGLTKTFGDFVAVDHVTFEVRSGEIVGYLGPNGSGKTTTIRMLCGLMRPTEGAAHLLGIDVIRNPEAVKPHIGYMSQRFALYDDLTVLENLTFYAGVYEVPRAIERQRIDEVLQRAGLTTRQNTLTNQLSGGWRQRLALGCAMVHHPPLLFLDEPTSGVDPVARREFWDLIYELAAEGATIFVTTHYMDEAEHCSRVGFMHRGRLLAFDTPRALKEAYLHGAAWDIACRPLLEAVELLGQLPGIVQASLQGDRAHAIVLANAWQPYTLTARLSEAGIVVDAIEPVESTLEDVFILLARS